jgi:hypothetical protein
MAVKRRERFSGNYYLGDSFKRMQKTFQCRHLAFNNHSGPSFSHKRCEAGKLDGIAEPLLGM